MTSSEHPAMATFAAADRFFEEHPVLARFQAMNEEPLPAGQVGPTADDTYRAYVSRISTRGLVVDEGVGFSDRGRRSFLRFPPELWRRMPKALRRIEIERATEDIAWTMVRRELTDYDAPAQFRPALRPTKTDTLVFVFANGTRASVPERQLAIGDFRDVIGPAFADMSGRPLRSNPYTDEMSIGDLWSMLTANAALLYSGGEPVAFRDGRIVLVRH